VIGATYTDGIVNDAAPSNAQAALSADYAAALRIDDVVPADRYVSMIKIDVEGHEYRAIIGARRTIETSQPAIISEFGPGALIANSGRTPGEYLRLLRSMGYGISVIGSPEITTDDAILAKTAAVDHLDILAVQRK
jgi:hypothetical protein